MHRPIFYGLCLLGCLLVSGCSKKELGSPWKELGFPVAKDQARLDPEKRNDATSMNVDYPNLTVFNSVLIQATELLTSKGFTCARDPNESNSSSAKATCSKGSQTIALYAGVVKEGAYLTGTLH